MQTTILSLLILSPLAAQEPQATGLTLSGPAPAATSLAATVVKSIATVCSPRPKSTFAGQLSWAAWAHDRPTLCTDGAGLARIDQPHRFCRTDKKAVGVKTRADMAIGMHQIVARQCAGRQANPKLGILQRFADHSKIVLHGICQLWNSGISG